MAARARERLTHFERLLLEAEDYLVDAMPDEPIGVVRVVVVQGNGRPTELVVSCGWLGRYVCRITVKEVHDVSPVDRRIRVHRSALSAVRQLRRD